MNSRRVLALLIGALVSGCVDTPLPEVPLDDVPDGWLVDVGEAAWPEAHWWEEFQSPELQKIIDEVRSSNLTLANNERNLERAEVLLREAGFDLFPAPLVSVGGAASYSGIETDRGSYADTGGESYTLDAGVVYADVLSKADRYDRARGQYDASVAQTRDVALNTITGAASTYFQVLLARDRISTAERNLDNAIVIEKILQARYEAGTITQIDALQQQIAVEQQRNAVRNFKQQELAARASLALLLARSVRDFDVTSQSLEAVSVPRITPGIPSELLARRPDLIQAEANLRVARAQVDLVRLAFLPDITLTAAANASSDTLGQLIASPDLFVNAAASLTQTLLDTGQRRRSVELARLDLESRLADYRSVVISVFNDVDVALSNIELLDALAQVALDDRARAEESFRIAEVRYREGVTDFQTVLIAQTSLYSARNRFLDNKLARLNAVVALYRSLGGAWSMP